MIDKYVSEYNSKADFCRAVGIKHQSFLNQILNHSRPVPPSVALRLRELHGASLHELRPDIYPAL